MLSSTANTTNDLLQLAGLGLSSTIIGVSVAPETTNIPFRLSEPDFQLITEISAWDKSLFNPSTDYFLLSEDSVSLHKLLHFSKKIINESVDIDPEYIDIVNENFWDLI
jgi:hypothetical protein